jgi:RND family efflux transporter MFP subunit
MRPWPYLFVFIAPVALACGGNEYVEPPPPAVTVAQPESRTVVDYLEFTGNTQSIATVEIRARIQGFLQKVNFEEGANVERGDVLFQIEPDEYRARVNRAKASLEVARTGKALADATHARFKQAFKTRAVSELELLEARAKADAAAAQVDSAQADLERAELDLSYTSIHAPITGRVGRSEVDADNLVGAEEKTLLTTIVQYDPMYAYFDMSERSVLKILGTTAEERARMDESNRQPDIPIELGRATDDGYPFTGTVDFSDLQLDASTGTFLMRGIFPNPDPIQLLPGLFVRVRIPADEREGALLVSERAIGSDQGGKYLLIVDDEDVVHHRPVEIGALVDGLRVIESGVESNEWVVVDGLLRARPGAKVAPQREGEPAAPTATPVAER